MQFDNSVLHKIIPAKDVLNMIGELLGNNLPKNVIGPNTEISLSFLSDHSVEIHIINTNSEA